MALSIPNTFAAASGNVAASQIDTDFTTIRDWINNRNPTSGLLSARPAAAFAGALYLATDTGLTYLDTGTTWITAGIAPVGLGVVRGYIAGLVVTNDGVSPNTKLDVAAGVCASGDQATWMTLGAFTGTTGGTWVVGTGNNKIDTGTIGASQWWYVWVISDAGATTVDILFSQSATAPTMPTGYTKKRLVWMFKTDGANAILPFTQTIGTCFRWKTPVLELNAVNINNTYATETLGAVPALAVVAFGNVRFSAATVIQVRPTGAADGTPSSTATPLGVIGSASAIGGHWTCPTNTSQQVDVGTADNVNIYLTTEGFFWDRGLSL